MSTSYVTTTLLDTFLSIDVGNRVIVTRSGELLNSSTTLEALRLLGQNQVFVQGTVGSSSSVAINGGYGSGYSVTITSTGQVFSGGANWGAVRLYSFGPTPAANQLLNSGEIHSAGGAGVESSGENARLVNNGVITAQTHAMAVSGNFTAVSNSGRLEATGSALNILANGLTLSNDGVMAGALYCIQGTGMGHRITNAGTITSGTAIALSNATSAIIRNTGTIHGSTFAFNLSNATVSIGNAGTISGTLLLGDGDVRLDNTGAINGAIETDTNSIIGFVLQNAGTIAARDTAIRLGDGNDRLANAGTILGSIALDSGNDVYDGRQGLWAAADPFSTGAIYGEAGDDTLLGGRAAETMLGNEGADLLEGADGDDVLFGGDAADTLGGGLGNDILVGGAGADDLDGGPGVDLLDYRSSAAVNVNLASGLGVGGDAEGDRIAGFEMLAGSAANDTLGGAAGPETLIGREGNDILTGAAGNDRLVGGTGNDRIEGGAGGDILAGGDGNDIFAFIALADSTVAIPTRDRIIDFQRGAPGAPLDRVDLSAIDALPGGSDNAFAFIGTAAFSAAGQLRYTIQGAVRTLVEAETTGDNKADFAILLSGGLALTASDFIL